MKHLVAFVLIVCSTVLCIGCGIVSRIVNDAKNPRIEDEKSIQQWLNKNDLKVDYVATVKPESFFSYYRFLAISKGTGYIFKADGSFTSLGHPNGKYCYKTFPELMQSLNPLDSSSFSGDNFIIAQYKIPVVIKEANTRNTPKTVDSIFRDTTYYHLDTIYHELRDLKGNMLYDLMPSGTDYLVVIPFAKYLGSTIQTKDILNTIKGIKANKQARIRVVLLNMDKQKWWGTEWNNRIQLSA
jgi:hypothetical protein